MDEYFRDENPEDDFGLSSTQLQSSNIMPSVNDKKRKEAAELEGGSNTRRPRSDGSFSSDVSHTTRRGRVVRTPVPYSPS